MAKPLTRNGTMRHARPRSVSNPAKGAVRELGGVMATARLLDVDYQEVQRWCRRGSVRLAKHCLRLAKISGYSPWTLAGL